MSSGELNDAVSEPLQFKPIPRVSTHETVIAQLANEIREGRLPAGAKLPPERQLAATLNVSRSSLRESLAVLEFTGIITSRVGSGSNAGTFVLSEPGSGLSSLLALQVALNHFELDEVVDFRRAIESSAARRLATQFGAGEVADLSRLNDLVDQSRMAKDFKSFAVLDVDFHLTLVELAGNRLSAYLLGMCRETLLTRMQSGFQQIKDWPSARELFIDQHQGIADAIALGDASLAEQRVLEHVTGPQRLTHPNCDTATAHGELGDHPSIPT